MEQHNNKPLAWFKFELQDAVLLRNSLTENRLGIFFDAFISRWENGEQRRDDLPGDVQFAYQMMCNKLAKSEAAYQKTCETNKKNVNARWRNKDKTEREEPREDESKNTGSVTFKPPSKTEFFNLVKFLAKEKMDLKEFDRGEVDYFYDDLSETDWTVEGISIQNRKQLDTAIRAKFDENNPSETWELFCAFMKYSPSELAEDWSMIDNYIQFYQEKNFKWTYKDENGKVTQYATADEYVKRILSDWESDCEYEP